MNNDKELLRIMLKDQALQKGIYRPSPYWERYQSRITAGLEKHGVESFRRISVISKGYGDAIKNLFETTALTSIKGKIYNKLIYSRPVKRYFTDPFVENDRLASWPDPALQEPKLFCSIR